MVSNGFMVGFSTRLRRMGRVHIGFRMSKCSMLFLGVFVSLWYAMYYMFVGVGWMIYGICLLYYWMFRGIYVLCKNACDKIRKEVHAGSVGE